MLQQLLLQLRPSSRQRDEAVLKSHAPHRLQLGGSRGRRRDNLGVTVALKIKMVSGYGRLVGTVVHPSKIDKIPFQEIHISHIKDPYQSYIATVDTCDHAQ